MKKLTLILVVMIVFVASSCSEEPTVPRRPPLVMPRIKVVDDVRVFYIDFIERYEDTLNAMFNYEWTLLSAEEIYREADTSNIPPHAPVWPEQFLPKQYLVWTIEYRDGNGDVRQFVFNNRLNFIEQIIRHVRDFIAEYYKERFFDVYMKDLPLAYFFFVFILRGYLPITSTENRYLVCAMEESIEEYIRLIGTPEGAIRLYQLTPANVFDMVPIRISIHVSLNEHSGNSNQQTFENDVITRIENMIEAMNQYTDNRLTASVSASIRRERWWNYIRGERIFVDRDRQMHFDRYVFEGYRGMFWE